MYSTGTVTTTANSTKLVGTGTKWLNNINRVSAEQAIQIQIGATVHNNSIQSIQSDTELTLNFPFPTAAKDAKYVILTTMVHSVSDAMNKIVAMNQANVQASDMQNRIMTENGVIDIPLPDGTVRKTRTENEKDRLLDGKFDKAGGTVSGFLDVTGLITARSGTIQAKAAKAEGYVQIATSADGTETMLNSKRPSTSWRKHLLPDVSGALMQVGDYGFGGRGAVYNTTKAELEDLIKAPNTPSQIFRNDGEASDLLYKYAATLLMGASATYALISVDNATGNVKAAAGLATNKPAVNTLYGTANTTKDSNGNLKAASPIIKVFADHIELNDESEGVELEKLSTGCYKLKGTLGMNADASWGGYHGGLVSPLGINGLELLWVDFKVLADGDIIIDTNYRKHSDLPPPVLLKRLITYPEFMDKKGNELESYASCDIPNGHWIDVRVNMPSNSLYNQKQAEAQRLAEIEAERLAKEEAERAQQDK